MTNPRDPSPAGAFKGSSSPAAVSILRRYGTALLNGFLRVFSGKIRLFTGLIFLVVLAGGGAVYALGIFPAQKSAPALPQTATVKTGDLIILVTAAGNVQPALEVPLSFRSGGLLAELNVSSGERVKAGQILARLDDTFARIQYEQAQIALAALLSPDAVLESELAAWNAQRAWEDADGRLSALEARIGTAAPPSEVDLELARANAFLAERKLEEARQYWSLLQQTEITSEDLDAVQGAAADRLKQARLAVDNAAYALENTVLTAPFDGIVSRLQASEDQMVGSTPILTLAALDQPVVHFYLEEGDIGQIKIGDTARISFSCYPDKVWEGEVYLLEPALGMVDGSPALVAWASLAPDPAAPLFSGMSADVEIVSGEARDALLVPVAALRELAPGSYAVFVVQSDGRLELTPVKVGLQDLTNAVIVEGLQAGDVVSTGNVAVE